MLAELALRWPSAAALADERGAVTFQQLWDAVRLRAAVLHTLCGGGGEGSGLCLYAESSYHAVEIALAVATVLRCKLLVASPSRLRPDQLEQLMREAGGVCCLVAEGSMRDALSHMESCFFLDAGLHRSLVGNLTVRGPDVELLLGGTLAAASRLPPEAAESSGSVVLNDDGLIRITVEQLASAKISVAAGALVCGARSSLGSALGLALLLRSLASGSCYSLRDCDLLSCSVAHLASVTPLSCVSGSAVVVCEPHEEADLRNLGFAKLCPVVISHTTDCGTMGSLYAVSDHRLGNAFLCPVAAILLAALRFGSIRKFLYSRVVRVEPEDVLQVSWSRAHCAVSCVRNGIEHTQMALFVMGEAQPALAIPLWCTEELEESTSVSCADVFAQLEAKGLQTSEAFQLLDGTADVSEGRCRVRLKRCEDLTVELLHSVLLAPLLLEVPIKGGLLMPRRVDAVTISDCAAVPTRCFVRRCGDQSYDVVAIDADVNVVLSIEGIRFEPVCDPVKAELFVMAWKTPRLPPPDWTALCRRGALFVVVDSGGDVPAWLEGMLNLPFVRCGTWKQAATLRDNVLVAVWASQWPNVQALASRLHGLTSAAVVISEVERYPQQALFWAMARGGSVRVVDVSESTDEVAAAVMTLRDRVVVLGRGVTELKRHHGPSKRLMPKSAVIVGGGAVAEALSKAMAGSVVVVDSGEAGKWGSALDKASVVFLCAKSWSRVVDMSLIQAFVSALPSGSRGIVVMPAKTLLLPQTASLSDLAAVEYCVACAQLTCLLVTDAVELNALDAVLKERVVCSAPSWMVEEYVWNNVVEAFVQPVQRRSSAEVLRQPFLVVEQAPNLCVIRGSASRLSSCGLPFLRERHCWDAEVFALQRAPTPSQVALLEVSWRALEDAFGGDTLPLKSTCIVCAPFAADEASCIVARAFDLAERFGSDGCSLRVVDLAVAMLSRDAEVVLIAACSPFDEEHLPSTLSTLLQAKSGRCRPFNARSGGWCRSEGSAAVVFSKTGSGVGLKGLTKGKKFRSMPAIDFAGACFAETNGCGMSDIDVAEAAALRRSLQRSQRRGESLVLGASKGSVGHTGQAAGLVALLSAAALLSGQVTRARKFEWFSELNPNIPAFEDGAVVVWPVEDVVMSPSFATACAASLDGAVVTAVLQKLSQKTELMSALVGVCGVTVAARSSRTLQRRLLECSSWLGQHTDCFPPKMNGREKHRVVVWGSSAKSFALSCGEMLSAMPRGEEPPVSRRDVWIAFSPTDVGLASAAHELVSGGYCSPQALERLRVLQAGHVSGPCSALLQFQTLVFDWLCSIISLDYLNLLCMGTIATRNAVAVTARDEEAFRRFGEGSARDDNAKKRLSKRVCVLECFAGLEAVRAALAQLPKGAVLGTLVLGPLSTAVVLRRTQFAVEAVDHCKAAKIRCSVDHASAGALLWAPMHRSAPLPGYCLPNKSRIVDLATGWAASSSSGVVGELWTESMTATSPWSTKACGEKGLVIELAPLGPRSLAMVLKKSATIDCVSVFARRSSPLRFLNELTQHCRVRPKEISGKAVPPHPFVRSAQLLPFPQIEHAAVLGCSWQFGSCATFNVECEGVDAVELAWRCLIARHPALRSVLLEEERSIGVYPARVASWWRGVDSECSVDAHGFPRFQLVRTAEGATVSMDAFGISDDDLLSLLSDLKHLIAGVEAVSGAISLSPHSYAWMRCNRGEAQESRCSVLQHFSARHGGAHTLESMIECIDRTCPTGNVAVFSRLRFCLEEFPLVNRTIAGSPIIIFVACLCGCRRLHLSAPADQNGAVVLDSVCRALDGDGDSLPDKPLHAAVAEVDEDASLLSGGTCKELRSRSAKLCEALTAVGCKLADEIAVASDSLSDNLVALLAASTLGLTVRHIVGYTGRKPLPFRVCLVDRKNMSLVRDLGCVVMVIDLVSRRSMSDERAAEHVAVADCSAALLVTSENEQVSQRELYRLAARLVSVLKVNADDVILCQDNRCAPLELFMAALSRSRITCSPSDATVAVVREALSVASPAMRAAAVLNPQVTAEQIACTFSNCKIVIRLKERF